MSLKRIEIMLSIQNLGLYILLGTYLLSLTLLTWITYLWTVFYCIVCNVCKLTVKIRNEST